MTMLRQDIRKIIITTIFRFYEVDGELSPRDNIIVMSFRTGLSERYIRALRKGDQNVQRNTVYALAIAMHLHPYLSEDFVRKGGGYPATKEGLYYRTLIERHYPEPLSYINEKLKARGYQACGTSY